MINSYPGFATGKPVVYGNIIVWEDKRNGRDTDQDWARNPGDIYMYDSSTKKETDIGWGSSPSIYGNKIVWFQYDFLSNIGNIYMYDISTKKESQISHSGSAVFSNIYGNKIVWQDGRNGNDDIYMYDLSTKKETQITTNTSNSINPVIYGNNIVWEDGRNGKSGIYAYDLIIHQQIHTTDQSYQMNPAIYDNKIVWVDLSNGKSDIYMGTISYLPVAAFTASPLSGKAQLKVAFVDKCTDAYYWYWNVGDKSSISTLKSPVHKYSKAGKYTVILTVKNAAP